MPDVLRVVATWAGFPGAPGFSNFYFAAPVVGTPAAVSATASVRTFFDSLRFILPTGVNITVDPLVAQLDAENGQQQDEITVGTPPVVVAGTGAATRSAPSGACVNWRTATFVGGRRLRGRTFIVPLSTAAYEADGTLSATTVTDLRAAAALLAANGIGDTSEMVVWHRPVNGAGGLTGLITASSVTDKAAVLTSRR